MQITEGFETWQVLSGSTFKEGLQKHNYNVIMTLFHYFRI